MSDPYLPLTADTFADPYSGYQRMLADDPHRSDVFGTWILSRYADVIAGLKDNRLTTRNLMAARLAHMPPDHDLLVKAVLEQAAMVMASHEPPDHTKKRAFLSSRFMRGPVEKLEPWIQSLADHLIDQVVASGEIDVIRDFAGPLPLLVISGVVGIPEEDGPLMKHLADESIELSGRPRADIASLEAQFHSAQSFYEYAQGLLEHHRKDRRDDLISDLLALQDRSTGFGDRELIANAWMVVGAGHETTTKLIGNGLLALIRHPDQMRMLLDRPDLIESAVEELLRYDAVVQTTVRLAREDVEIADRQIRAGEMVHFILGAANRDPAQFPDPDRLDITRSPNRHLGFGIGTHFCLGAHLARLEARIAIGTLVRRLSDLRVSGGELAWNGNLTFRGLNSLNVEFRPGAPIGH